MGKDTSEYQIWHKIISKFNEEKIDCVLVGGVALVIHGIPKSTIDIDIYVPATENILNKLFQISDTLGMENKQRSILNVSHSPALFTGQWICFSYEGQDILDVFFADKKEFNLLYENSEQKQDKNLFFRVASLNDIIAMKKSSGRPVDLADIKLIEEFKKYKEDSK